jgi:hypothetical protein
MAKRKTTEKFIEEGIKVHDNKFDYSLTVYTGIHNEVTIICPKHDKFTQIAKVHLRGSDCPDCAEENRINKIKNRTASNKGVKAKTLEERTIDFINNSNKIHNNFYSYNNINYINNSTIVMITCPEHGDFPQIPNNHLMGKGCKECGKIKNFINITYTFDEFKEMAIKTHGNNYNYDKANYINLNTEIDIICPIHDVFPQLPVVHLNGSGCPKCVGKNKTTEDFIKEAREIHGDKYDYSKVCYKGSNINVDIICPIHDVFPQTPAMHISDRNGCPKCAKNYKIAEENFIERAKMKHDDKYDYSKFIFVNADTDGIIICPFHGEFLKTPRKHINGRGCPECIESSGERYLKSFFKKYKIKYIREKTYKDCINIVSLRFDFYLFDYNILIEFDGKQHFKMQEIFGGEEAFNKLKMRDEIKNKYCEDNNIPLYRFNYKQLRRKKSEIENRLKEILNIK